MPPLDVQPQSAVLAEKQTQTFTATAEGKPTDVTWSIAPTKGSGSIDAASGAYTAPRFIFRSRKASVIATPTQGGASPGRAVVELSSLSFWTAFLGTYMVVAAVGILVALTLGWERMCPACDDLSITPPVVTLADGGAQQFRANAAVRWSPELDASGIYRTPDDVADDRRVTISATSLDEASNVASATIYLSSSGGLALTPNSAVVEPNGKLELTAVVEAPRRPRAESGTPTPTPTPAPSPTPAPEPSPAPSPSSGETGLAESDRVIWMQPEAGELRRGDTEGAATFTAPAEERSRPILVLARTNETPPRLAGASIIVAAKKTAKRSCAPSGSPAFRGVLLIIVLMGAVGGLIHGISSFATYTGNRELLPSWAWWYCLKPLLGSLVALAVYLVFRAGLGSADYSLDTADCVKVAAFAVLIGLFAENATLKLKDIFETIFQPRDDPRRHKAGTVAPLDPKIDALEPAFLVVGGGAQTLIIKGSGFGSVSQVKVDGVLRKPSQTPTATEIRLDLTPQDQDRERKLSIQVVNPPPDGRVSNEISLEVRNE